MLEERKHLIRISFEGVSMHVETKNITLERAHEMAKKEIDRMMSLGNRPKLYVIETLNTEKDWDAGTINFCPRCAKNVSDYELKSIDSFTCPHCSAFIHARIQVDEEYE